MSKYRKFSFLFSPKAELKKKREKCGKERQYERGA